jgi:hypothetical protein
VAVSPATVDEASEWGSALVSRMADAGGLDFRFDFRIK